MPELTSPSPLVAMPRSLYVYYRVAFEQWTSARLAITDVQAHLRQQYPGLRALLMQRADTQEDAPHATWMEVYEHPDGVSPACEARLQDLIAALPDGLIGERHVETFCPLAAGLAAPACSS